MVIGGGILTGEVWPDTYCVTPSTGFKDVVSYLQTYNITAPKHIGTNYLKCISTLVEDYGDDKSCTFYEARCRHTKELKPTIASSNDIKFCSVLLVTNTVQFILSFFLFWCLLLLF